MKSTDIPGFKATVLELLANNKRSVAFEILEHFFDKAKTLVEFDVIGELALKAEHRQLHLQCAETAHSVALTSHEKRASRTNLISAYNMMNFPEKALHYIEFQLAQTPNDFSVLCQKAANLSLLGNKTQSEKIVLELLNAYPEKSVELESMLSGKYLREGQLSKGIMSFVEAIKAENKLFEHELKMPRWEGIPRPNRTVYVDGEGGIGDEIINIRFFKRIKDLGMKPVLCSPNNTFYADKNQLFKRHGIEVLSESYTIDKHQYWVPMMSLPAVLNLTESDLWYGPYLFPTKQKKNKLHTTGLNIGIKCSGNPYFAQDEYRKIPIEQMIQCLPKHANIYYIDKKAINYPGVIDLADKIDSWEDTLDFIDQMDYIVSSCTSLVHAAGAIGKKTFVAVPIAEYYIWTTSRQDTSSPWYGDNFYVIRQTKPRDWSQPLNTIRELLAKD